MVAATRRLRGSGRRRRARPRHPGRHRGGRRRCRARASRSRWSCPPAGASSRSASGFVVDDAGDRRLRRGGVRAGQGRHAGRGRAAAAVRPEPHVRLQWRKRWIMVVVYPRDVAIRPVEENDRPTVEWLTTQLWGAPEVAVHDGVFYPAALPGFIAERAGRIAGLVTFEVRERHPGDRHDQRPRPVPGHRHDAHRGGPRRGQAPRLLPGHAHHHQRQHRRAPLLPAPRLPARRDPARARWTAPASSSRRFPAPEISAFRSAMKSTSPAPSKRERFKIAIPNVCGFLSYLTCALSPLVSARSGALFTQRVRVRAVARPAECAIQGFTTVRGSTMLPPVRVRTAGDEPVPVVD